MINDRSGDESRDESSESLVCFFQETKPASPGQTSN